MPWTDEPVPTPRRSESELYADVQRRAATIRRRRRAGVSAGLGSVVTVLLVAFALSRTGDDRASQLRVVGGDESTTTSVAQILTTVAPTPSTSLSPLPSTTRPPATRPPTTRTTLRSTTTLARPTTTTTSTLPPPLRQCSPGEVVVTATPERPSYPASAPVNILVAAQNRSSRACQPADPSVEFRTAAGAVLFAMSLIDAFTMGIEGEPQPSWDPGETLSMTMQGPPLHDGDTGVPCPPGTYTATAIFGPFRSPPAAFTLT